MFSRSIIGFFLPSSCDHYSCFNARNFECYFCFHVVCTDKPLGPEGPLQVMDIYKDRCHLSWEPPKDDGGLGIDYYLVESQNVESSEWTLVGRVPEDTQCGVPNLEVGKKYRFRVKAINSAGESEPLLTSDEILAKDPWGIFCSLYCIVII